MFAQVSCSHASHATTRDALCFCPGFLCVCVKDRSKGQRARAKGHRSGDEGCPSPGQYETKPEFREDGISTVSSLSLFRESELSLYADDLKECWSHITAH